MKTNPNLTLIAYGMTGDFLSSLAFQAVNQVKTKLSQSLKVNQIQVLSETEAYRNWGFGVARYGFILGRSTFARNGRFSIRSFPDFSNNRFLKRRDFRNKHPNTNR